MVAESPPARQPPVNSGPRLVLHADVDAFFCQVEALRSPGCCLVGLPLAVQQHQDVISVTHSARRAGVRKHMAPAEARRLLAAVGGRLVHVYCEAGTRPSYRPYRETSAALMRLLRGLLPPGAVLEKASIDEAYVELPVRPGSAVLSPYQAGTAAGALPAAERLAEALRREAREKLGLTLSVGIAPNKLLAKLASRAAKPDGVRALVAEAEVRALLDQTPLAQLPGMGGRVAESLAAAGYHTAGQLAAAGLVPEQLAARCGLRPAAAVALVGWCRGQDDRPVAEKGPPQAIQVQMTLTPVPRPMHPAMAARAPTDASGESHHLPPQSLAHSHRPGASGGGTRSSEAAGHHRHHGRALPAGHLPTSGATAGAGEGPGGDAGGYAAGGGGGSSGGSGGSRDGGKDGEGGGMLLPLYPLTADGRARLARLVRAMAGDLVARVMLDRHEEQRWPRRLGVQLVVTHVTHGTAAGHVTHGSDGPAGGGGVIGDSVTASRSCAFPSPALLGSSMGAPTAGGGGVGKEGGQTAKAGASAGVEAAVAVAPTHGGAGGSAGGGMAVPGASLIVGERAHFSAEHCSSLVNAVVVNALQLCNAILGAQQRQQQQDPGPPLTQVHLTAHSFGPYEAAAAGGNIGRYFSSAAPAHGTAAPAAAAAAAAAARAAGGRAPAVANASPAAALAAAAAGGGTGMRASAEAKASRAAALAAATAQPSPSRPEGGAEEEEVDEDDQRPVKRLRFEQLEGDKLDGGRGTSVGRRAGKGATGIGAAATAGKQLGAVDGEGTAGRAVVGLLGEGGATAVAGRATGAAAGAGAAGLEQRQLLVAVPQPGAQQQQQQQRQWQQGTRGELQEAGGGRGRTAASAAAAATAAVAAAAAAPEKRSRRRQVPRGGGLPDPLPHPTQMMAALWPPQVGSAGSTGRGGTPGGRALGQAGGQGGGEEGAAGRAAEELWTQLDAWLGVFGAPGLEEWWEELRSG